MVRYVLPILSPIPSLCNSQSYQVVLSSDPPLYLAVLTKPGKHWATVLLCLLVACSARLGHVRQELYVKG